ncbi:SUMO-interacting motif-containing protein 1 isoform X1 [Epinephelus fuscoguttatus]|uniref:SUMO-interacting motif-containing protein 1 isoform X1 n=2 Tax=Epinephelus fuscoguttatus TaxID=293821 RepID=UPI0020D024F1|nr:SUMO-interacting motif-containing protein 1 isoform X1 [Epinephelus fuscoguttatus]
MADVITLSSDSEKDDSDVEIIGCYSNVMTKDDPLPLTAVRVHVDDINVSPLYIDLKDPKWTLPELKLRARRKSPAVTVVDLTEGDVDDETKQETANLPPDDPLIVKESATKNQTSNNQDFNLQKSSSRDPTVTALQPDCSNLKPKKRRLDSQTQHQEQTDNAHHHTAFVKLRRLPCLETHVALNKNCTQMSLHLSQLDNTSETAKCISNLRTTTTNGPHTDPSLDESPPKVVESLIRQEEQESNNEFTNTQLNANISQHLQSPADHPCSDKGGTDATLKEHSTHEDERDDFCSSVLIPSPTSCSPSQDKAQGSLQREVLSSKLEQLGLDKAQFSQSHLSDHSSSHYSTTLPNPSEPYTLDSLSQTGTISHNPMSQVDPAPTSESTLAEKTPEWQLEEVNNDEASNSSDCLRFSIPSEPPLSENMDDESGAGTYRGDLIIDSPVSLLWQEGSDGDEGNKESRFDMDFRAASKEDRQFVCPVTLRKIMSGPAQALFNEEDDGFGTPEVLCRQSLSLVYSTIDEGYPEGTLQLLSDLLQPGYYPPRDITSHLLRGILLDPQCPYHLCVQAFNLLMRTQRHHMADKTTIPWDWELLTSVMTSQDHTKRHQCEVVRMLLEYVVQTLEDDFQAKCSVSALNRSIAKEVLSCDQQFHRIRDVIKWLFSAIIKSTEHRECKEAAKERDEQIRMVFIFQRMLSLALEVDRSPALNSAKLSQELFHMLISDIPLRAHRMLLLESLQSKLLRCKLLEHLLDYACPMKISLPMSLSLLLHFLKFCTLAPDPSDGTERWHKWEELVHLLWMLLLSYNKAMKGYLCNSVSEQRGRVVNLVYKPDDIVSKPAICEAVEAFLSRSQADIGQALPLHVEESLTYLQDHLLDVCQC